MKTPQAPQNNLSYKDIFFLISSVLTLKSPSEIYKHHNTLFFFYTKDLSH